MESTGSNAGISPLDELQRQLAEDLAQVVAAPTPPPAAQPSTNLVATTVSTIVLQGGPLQLVIALLKSGERLYIKVADLLPKFTFLGPSLDEALNLQREHEELLRQIQNLPTPLEEFYHKVQEKIAANEPPNPVLIEEMAASLGAVWQDIKKMLQERRDIVLINVNFFERLGECYGKMSSLEVACNDTMIPIEIDAVRDFLESFKTLRTDMLTSISAALKVGNQLLDRLRELANIGTLDSRPNHIKQDAIYAVGQVERWLEDLSNRRNNLEQAWQSRKTQLEQCLTLAILAKELADIEYSLNASRNSNLSSFTLGDSSEQARDLLDTYQNLKPDALLLRDKSLKITKATEELVATGCFAGDEACAKAYSVLAACTEFVDEIDHRESLLSQSREFFGRAENLLTKLTQIEMELSNDQQLLTISEQTLQELTSTITQVLQAGYSLIDDVGRTKPEVTGVQTMVERIEQKKLVFERYSLQQSEHNLRLTEALNEFMERYNLLFQWMADARKERIEQGTGIHRMGESLAEAKDCLLLHHQLLNDLEIKGNAINNLLARLTPSLEYLEDGQRDDVQQKVDLLRQQWIELKNYVIARVDLLKLYIRFHQEAETVRNLFDAYQIQRDTFRSGENDKPLLQAALDNIRQQLAPLGPLGGQFRECAAKVASDPYLQQAQAVQCVERTLAELNARQLAVGNEWDRWNAQHHTEAVLNDIMAANMETLAAASKLEEQLYPIFNTASDNPTDLSAFIATKQNQIQADIRAAEHELTKRFETIDQLATPEGDSPTSDSTDKVIQVKNSLNSIKTKLHTIAADFQELATVIDRFLHAVLTCRDNIKEYFASKQTITGPDSVESITNSYEQFKQNTMEYFRNLLQQSEQIIDRIKAQEPPGAKEQDTDKIITLLENLRTYFESETESENSELRKQHAVIGFDKALNEVRGAIRERREQLDRARGNYGENADGARGTLAAFEEFERGLQDLESRIETFVSSSQGLASQYPETSQYVHAEATKVRNEWADLVNRTQEYRQLTTVSIEYFELISVVENNYRNLNADLINANNKLSILNNPDLANDLVQQIDNILKVYETQQLDTLKQISALSSKLYDHDKSVALYNDNLKLFQTFYKIKNDINERAKELTEQQRSQEAEQNGFCEITTTTTTTTHNGLPQQQSFDIQTVDEAQYIQEPQEPLVIQTVEESHNVQSHEVVTTVEQPPATLSVPQPLSDVSVQEGQRVQLQCVIFGRPEPSIEWFKDGISIQNNPDYKTTFDNGLCTLTIDETVTADSAEFLCRAINDAGIAESAARLIVTEPTPPGQPPLFTQQLNNGTATEGHPFQYRCTVTALEPTEYPSFRAPLSNVMARVGQKIKLEAEVAGIPPPEVMWTHDGQHFANREVKPVQNNFYTQQQQQHQQQQQMYSSFSSSQQFQSSQMSQQQYSQSMQYQPYQPYKPSVEPIHAPQPIQAPMPVYAPQPTFAPQPQPQPTFAPQPQPAFVPQPQPTFAPQPKPVLTYAPAPQTLPQPFKPTPVAPVAKFAPAPEPVPVVHHSLASAPSNVPSFGPSYNQTPQPFKPLPPPSITPSQASFTSGPPVDFPPVPQTFLPAYVPPPVQTFTPAPAPVEPIPQFTPAPAPVQAPAPAPMQPPTNFPEPLYQQQPQEQVFGQQHNEYVHHQQLQQYHQQQVHMEEEVYKKKSVKETKQLFEQTIRQQNESFNDLKAPRMIQQMVNSPTKVCTLPPDFGCTPAEIGLEPGPQPTMGCAPKPSNERRSSYCREKIEQSLFESMDKVPERVPAGGVKIVPPSPRKKSNPGQSDTAGMPPASFEQPSEAKATQPIANANAATKSPFTATESECESDMDVMRKMNGVSGYLADTEEVQKTVSFSSEQKIESFSKSESSVIVQSSEVVQQQQEQQQQQQQTVVESSSIESKVETVEDAAATVTDAGVTAEAQQPQQKQQQSEEQVVTTTTTTAEAVTKESVEEMNFLVNNDLPEDLQPVKVLPTEEPLPTLKKVPVPAAVQPEPQPEPVVCEPVPEPAPVQQNGFSAEQHEIEAEKTTINPVWQPTQAGVAYKPVHPVFNPPQQHETGPTVAPPSVFDPIEKLPQPTAVSEMARPQPISYSTQQTSSSQSFQQQKSSSFQSYQQQTFVQQQQQQEQQHVSFPPVEPAGQPALYYTSVTAQPVHNTIATETSNTLHMKETTESSNRVVNMQQTQQVISLGHQPRPAFVQKQGRDSDYDSDGSRIRPMWTPNPSDSDEPHFRSVRPNFASRSTSLPRTYERIQTPMEFDTGPVLMPTKIDVSGVMQQQQQQQQQQQEQTTETVEVLQTQTLDRKFTTKQMATQHMSTSRDDMAIKAHKVAPINFVQKAQNQAESMSQSFKTKAYHFTNEVMTDMRKTPIKPILKNAFGHQQAPVTHVLQPVPQAQATPATNGTSTPQAYREESRVSQYGTRHVDPDTGIIYFKYDFGYEFGIIFPGEGHRIVAGSGHSKRQPATTTSSSVKHPLYLSPTPFGPSGAQSVEVPVIHERTRDYVRNCTPSPFRRSASVPASDLQASRYQQRYSYPAAGSGRSTPRVTHFRPVSSRCTTPDHSAASVPTQGSTRSATSTPKHPQDPAIATKQPLFVAPLKDIAVVAGQPARFECIVACDATPAVRWTKNNVPIDESGQRYYPEYRNGVCRLSLPVAYEGDSARYCCVAENHLGHSQTCADLTVVDSNWRTASAVTEF